MANNQKILVSDDYKVFDSLKNMARQKPKAGPLGWVRVYFQNKLEFNNIVY